VFRGPDACGNGKCENEGSYSKPSIFLKKGKGLKNIKVGTALKKDDLLKDFFEGYQLKKDDIRYLPSNIIPINTTQKQIDLVIRLLRENEKISDFLKISEGFRIPAKFEVSSKEKFEILKQYQFNRYSPVEEGSYVSETNL